MEAQNTYGSPQGELPTAATAFNEPKFLALNGRIGRLRYLAYGFGITLLFTLVIAALSIPLGFLAGNTEGGWGIGLLIFALYIPLIVFSFGYAVRRLNDLNLSGWLSLLFLVPLANIGLGLYLTFGKGTEGPNKYGLPPPPNGTGIVILGLALPVIFIIGLLAAVAIPAYMQFSSHAAFESPTDTTADDNSLESATDAIIEPSENEEATPGADETEEAVEPTEENGDEPADADTEEPATEAI